VKTPSTDLEARLGETFRAARAELSAGWPSCPVCHGGQYVRDDQKKTRSNDWVRRYRCRACDVRFSDQHGTPLAHTQKPITVWALLVLMHPSRNPDAPSFEALSRLTGVGRQRLTEMQGRLLVSALAARWTVLLGPAGITVRQLVGAFPEPRRTAYAKLAFNPKGRAVHKTLAKKRAAR
jgi:transposase-like protein